MSKSGGYLNGTPVGAGAGAEKPHGDLESRDQIRTLALTLSNDGGLTMEKQMRKTSVCG